MEIDNINIVTLAYLGDAVYELYIREYLIKNGIAKVIDLQNEAIRFVSAKNQNEILKYLIDCNILSDEEIAIVKRGRNYKRDSHPKGTDIITYKMSTGFEALIGYLYLNRQSKRLEELINYIVRFKNEKIV